MLPFRFDQSASPAIPTTVVDVVIEMSIMIIHADLQ
jgi:hypothetical protein